MRSIKVVLFLLVAGLGLIFTGSALAQEVPIVPGPGEQTSVPEGPAAGFVPLYLLALGSISPLAGYLLNYLGPQTSEQVKGIVQGVLAAGVAVLYQAVTDGNLGLNDQTLLAVMTAMFGALAGHLGWAAAGINTALGAGKNASGAPPTSVTLVGR